MQVPKLRFKEFNDDWQEKKLKDVATGFSTGQTPSRLNTSYWNGDIKWISSGELNYNFIEDSIEYITEQGAKSCNLTLLPKGTFLIAITGLEAKGTRGSCAVLNVEATTNQSCMAIYPKKMLSTYFLFLWYQKVGDKYAFKYCQGTKQQSYNSELVKELAIFLPSLEEQTKVANFLSLIDKKIELQTQLVDNLNLYKKGLLQKVFSNNTGWETTKLGDCLNLITNGISNNQVDYITDYPVTRIETISSGYIDYSKVGYINYSKNINEFKLSKGDILFSNINSVKHIGKVAFFNSDLNLYHGMNLLRICANKKLNSKFLYYLLNTYDMKKYFTINCKQAVNQASLSIEDICRCIIKIPSIEEQNRIAELFTSLDKKIDFETEKLENLKTYKKGLLQKMFI